MSTRKRIAALLTQMHGRQPTEDEIDDALRGYHDAQAEVGELQRTLPADDYRDALHAEATKLIDEINRGPRKPN